MNSIVIKDSLRQINKKYFLCGLLFAIVYLFIVNNCFYSMFGSETLYIYYALTIILATFVIKEGMLVHIELSIKGLLVVAAKALTLVIMTFMFFGFQIMQNVSTVRLALLVFGVFVFWVATLIRFVIFVAKLVVEKNMIFAYENDNKYNIRKVWLVLFLIVFTTGLIMSIIYYPGHITPDNATNYYCATCFGEKGTVTDIHSMLYILCTRVLMIVTRNYYIITFLLLLAFSATWASFFSYLYKKGLKVSVVIIITICWISFPFNLFMLICSWKDNPFAVCLLLLTYMLSKICLESAYGDNWLDLIVLFLSLLGVALFRSNGLVIYCAVFIAILFLWLQKKIKMRIFATVLLAGAVIVIFKGPVLKALGVEKIPESYNAIPFMDGIMENLYFKTTLEGDALTFIDEYFYESDLDRVDNFTFSTYSGPRILKKDEGAFEAAKKAYMWCLIKHPQTTIRARMERTYNLWGVFNNRGYRQDYNYLNELPDYNIEGGRHVPIWKHPEKLAGARNVFGRWLYDDESVLGVIWHFLSRCGLHLFLWMICLYELIKNNKIKYMLVILPGIVNVVALMIGCCYTDCRYFYPMFLISVPFYFVLALVFNEKYEI